MVNGMAENELKWICEWNPTFWPIESERTRVLTMNKDNEHRNFRKKNI